MGASEQLLPGIEIREAIRFKPEKKPRVLNVAGLFAGVGGIELGFSRAGHETLLLCENDETAKAVLADRFDGVKLHSDVTTLKRLPARTDVVTAGFPCQDLSQAGKTVGIEGARSGLVGEVFRLVEHQQVPWLVLENVPFMLQLAKGRALEVIIEALEYYGYKWAYRVVDARAFGLPQRRQRVFFVASLDEDPRHVLFADDIGTAPPEDEYEDVACGFYWTEGIRGLGWAVNAVPTLKGGSTVGIPSPPAIWLPSGEIVKPDIRDAERMQGFRANWTRPAEQVAKRGMRWKLVGNAVAVPVAKWLGRRLARPGSFDLHDVQPLREGKPWPKSAWNVGSGRFTARISAWPKHYKRKELAEFLLHEPTPLSVKATRGFLSRTEKGTLNFPDGFIDAVRDHLKTMEATV